jgi:hypothetical protein
MIGEIEYFVEPEKDFSVKFKIGQFYLAPIPYMLETRISYLSLDYFDVKNPSNFSLKTEVRDISGLRNHAPPSLSEVGFPSKTFSPILPHKFRPVIGISDQIPIWNEFDHSRGYCIVVIPLYSMIDDTGFHKFSQKFINCVQAYKYPSLYYIPDDVTYGIHESLARFDRITAVRSDILLPIPTQFSDDAIFTITKWLQYFLGGELDEILESYRNAALLKINGK